MSESYFQFKQFIIHQQQTAMKVCTDSCLFGSLLPVEKIRSALDIGTGTGLLALQYAQLNRHAIITALDIDAQAFRQASENIIQSKFHDRITAVHTGLKDFHPGRVFDLLICNPPFYKNDLKSIDTARNTAMHGSDLDLEFLLQKGSTLLAPDGKFYIMIPFSRMPEMEKLLGQVGFCISEKIHGCYWICIDKI
jgi:tRNA1Val (adenine37-N6)-methyltransferase